MSSMVILCGVMMMCTSMAMYWYFRRFIDDESTSSQTLDEMEATARRRLDLICAALAAVGFAIAAFGLTGR